MRKHRLIEIIIPAVLLVSVAAVPLHAGDTDGARDVLNKIVAQEKYTYAESPASGLTSPADSLMEKINRYLKSIWKRITEALGSAGWIGGIIYVLLASGVCVLLFLIFLRIDFSCGGASRRSAVHGSGEINMDFQRELRTANKLARQGKNSEAVSTAVNALWLFLHYREIIRYTRSTTNREYLSMMNHSGNDNGAFHSVPVIIRNSETAVYAESSVTGERCNEIISSIAALISK